MGNNACSEGGDGGAGAVFVVMPTSLTQTTYTFTCNTGYYTMTTTVCDACTNLGQYSVYSGPGTNSTNCPTSCVPGTYRSDGVCALCPSGTYSTGGSITSCTPCQTCGTGSYQSTLCPQGSTEDVSQCICNPGYYTVGVSTPANPIPCNECPAGTYSPTVNATSYPCTQCPPGTYSSLTARTNSLACVPCLPGSFGATPGSSEGPQQ